MKVLLNATLLIALLLAPGAGAAAPDGERCVHLDLVKALSTLNTGPNLKVVRDRRTLSITDLRSDELILVANCDGLSVTGPETVRRPIDKKPATTRVVKGPDGRRVYSHSVSARGARTTVIEAGQVNKDGLHVLAFDNDDVHISDGLGNLVFSVRTDDDGGLVEREGKRYGCGCERRTQPDGRTETRPL